MNSIIMSKADYLRLSGSNVSNSSFELLLHEKHNFLIYKTNVLRLRPQDLLCYAETSNKLGSDELWLSLWVCLYKFLWPLKVASVRR